jgi:hypothetical protein
MERHLGLGEPPTIEFAPQPRAASFLRIGSAGCIIVTIRLPDPNLAILYISAPHVARSSPKENLRAPKTTLDQALFSIRGTRRIALFSTWMRFWRYTGSSGSPASLSKTLMSHKLSRQKSRQRYVSIIPCLDSVGKSPCWRTAMIAKWNS